MSSNAPANGKAASRKRRSDVQAVFAGPPKPREGEIIVTADFIDEDALDRATAMVMANEVDYGGFSGPLGQFSFWCKLRVDDPAHQRLVMALLACGGDLHNSAVDES